MLTKRSKRHTRHVISWEESCRRLPNAPEDCTRIDMLPVGIKSKSGRYRSEQTILKFSAFSLISMKKVNIKEPGVNV